MLRSGRYLVGGHAEINLVCRPACAVPAGASIGGASTVCAPAQLMERLFAFAAYFDIFRESDFVLANCADFPLNTAIGPYYATGLSGGSGAGIHQPQFLFADSQYISA